MSDINCVNAVDVNNNRELTITTNKYVYNVKFVGAVDSNSPYKGWLTCDVKVGIITPKRNGGVTIKNVIKDDIRIHPSDPRSNNLNNTVLSKLLITAIAGRYTVLFEKNKKLTQEILDSVVSDLLVAIVDPDRDMVETAVSLRSKSKAIKPLEVGIMVTRYYSRNEAGNFFYCNTKISAGHDVNGGSTFSLMANDIDAPLPSDQLRVVLMTGLYKLTVDLETHTGFNPKAL